MYVLLVWRVVSGLITLWLHKDDVCNSLGEWRNYILGQEFGTSLSTLLELSTHLWVDAPAKKKWGAPWAHRSSRAPLAPMPFGLSFRFVFLRSAWLGFTIGAFTIGTVWCTGASQVMMCCWRGKVLDTVYRGRGLRAPCSSQNSDELYEILFHSRTPTHVPSGSIDPKLLYFTLTNPGLSTMITYQRPNSFLLSLILN